MDRQILNFTANEQILTCENPIRISTNKVNYIEAHFVLGQNWSGYDSVRAIWFNDFQTISTVLDSLGTCRVPFEVMKRKGCVKVNLVGSISEDDVLTDRLTSYPIVAVIVDCTAQIVGANTSPITPSEFEQFAQRVHADAERAEQGATNAEQSAQNASQSAQSAHDDKIAIEQAIAEVIQQIEDFEQVQVVVNTLPPSSQATSDFTDGVLTLGIPQGVKGDTGNGIQSITKTGTSGLVDTYTITFTDGQTTTFTVTNGAKGDTGNGIASIEKTSTVGLVDTYTITYTDGTTSTFTVTNGEKGDKGDTGEVSLSELEDATIVQTLSDNEPYHYRRTNNGNGAGHREYDMIVGGTIVWNQLVEHGNFDASTGWSGGGYGTISASDNIGSYILADAGYSARLERSFTPIVGHKMLASIDIKLPYTATGYTVITFQAGGYDGHIARGMPNANVWTHLVGIRNVVSADTTSGKVRYYVSAVDGSVGDVIQFKNAQIIDLTQMFGSTIADYIYSLEQSTAGSGVAWLKTHFPRLFDNGYQPYDSGSIKSVSGLQSHDMVGFNAWDEEWEVGSINTSGGQNTNSSTLIRSKNYIPVIPNETYWAKAPASSGGNLFYYDADKNYLSYVGFAVNTYYTIPSNARYVRFRMGSAYGTTYKNDICFNISDASIDGQYFPYEHHSCPLDSSVTLRGKYVLENGQLKAVGDVWKNDGNIDRTWAEVDLGSLRWVLHENGFFYAVLNSVYVPAASTNIANGVCERYVASTYGAVSNASTSETKVFAFGVGSFAHTVCIGDSAYSDATAFKTAMNGVYLVYELATPTTENATPYENPQWCDSHGTEEYVGSELPVGHNTDYPMTMVDCADGLGNGTYEARLTIANGVKTFTWQSV